MWTLEIYLVPLHPVLTHKTLGAELSTLIYERRWDKLEEDMAWSMSSLVTVEIGIGC